MTSTITNATPSIDNQEFVLTLSILFKQKCPYCKLSFKTHSFRQISNGHDKTCYKSYGFECKDGHRYNLAKILTKDCICKDEIISQIKSRFPTLEVIELLVLKDSFLILSFTPQKEFVNVLLDCDYSIITVANFKTKNEAKHDFNNKQMIEANYDIIIDNIKGKIWINDFEKCLLRISDIPKQEFSNFPIDVKYQSLKDIQDTRKLKDAQLDEETILELFGIVTEILSLMNNGTDLDHDYNILQKARTSLEAQIKLYREK